MSTETQAPATGVKRTLGAWQIIFLIVAAMTPLSSFIGVLPLGISFGGPSLVLVFVITGAVLALFAVGYGAIVKKINRPGAFYAYITRGLGKPIGVGAALLAAIGYTMGFIGSFAITGFINRDSFLAIGVDLPWQVWMFIMLAIVVTMTWFRIDFSSTVLGIIVIAEIVLVLWFIFSVIGTYGIAEALPASVLSPDVFNIGSWTVAFIFAILCFTGFEAGALYAPETKNPGRAVPLALYGSVIIIVVLNGVAAWTLIGAAGGVDQAMTVILEQGLAGFVFGTAAATMGPIGVTLLSLGGVLAQIAILVAITNFMSRYIASIARERILPRALGKYNRYGAPSTAIFVLLALGIVIPLVAAAVNIDPYTIVSPTAFAMAAIVATVIQALTSLAVFFYFSKNAEAGRHWWKTTTAPLVAFVLLVAALVIQLMGFDYIAGPTIPWAGAVLPPLALVIFIVGLVYAVIIRKSNPEVYAKLAEGDTAEDAHAAFAA